TTPLWLIEGFADYVGYLRTRVGVRAAAGELRREVAAGRVPSRLPSADALSGGSERLSQADQEAGLARRARPGRHGGPAAGPPDPSRRPPRCARCWGSPGSASPPFGATT